MAAAVSASDLLEQVKNNVQMKLIYLLNHGLDYDCDQKEDMHDLKFIIQEN